MKRSTKLSIFLGITAISLSSQSFSDELDNNISNETIEQNYFNNAQNPGSVMFNPPEGWHLADPKALPPSVKLMVVGQSASSFPPSINLGTEKFDGNLKKYLNMIKSINESQGSDWKDLGTIRTQAGTASLSQVDAKTEWGEIRMMHVILVRETTAYILTAAALKEEFSKFYKDFFKSMRSLRFNKDVYDMIGSSARQNVLKQENDKLKKAWQAFYKKARSLCDEKSPETKVEKIFASKEFQEQYWTPFKEMISTDYKDMGKGWQKQLLNQIQNELMTQTK
ncbi:MAG: hypothetical protein VX777_00005 [Chlamydiota bacterium]|nr:hypothetical protein [Chlamydiota bacterium]